MTAAGTSIVLPVDLRPSDGRFGSGPSRVRQSAMDMLTAAAPTYMGTSHRRDGVRDVVRRIQSGVAELLSLPADYEVLLGNGGTTLFWDAAAFGLIRNRSQHAVFGEFSGKFATVARRSGHLADPVVAEASYGTKPQLVADPSCDTIALTHSETSTGVMMDVQRPPGASAETLVAIDATSAAGGLHVNPTEFDVYYFAPQKCLAADGGLWIAAVSPLALERIEELAAVRIAPATLDLGIALENSRKNQTYNTPALATLFLVADTLEWILANGGLKWSAGRCDRSAEILYGWAESSSYATPFVTDPSDRCRTVGTIDLADNVDAGAVASTLRANGIVDTEPYRKLGRNQLRIAMFPAIEPDDVATLTKAIDYIVERLPHTQR